MAHYIVFSGGREYDGVEHVREVLAFMKLFYGDDLRVLHGDHREGLDRICKELCEEMGIRVKGYPADWGKHGVAAGPIRNAKMAQLLADWAKLGHSVQAVTFPGGNGTRSLEKEADRREIPVDVMFSEP